MIQNQKVFILTELAEAAYADLRGTVGNPNALLNQLQGDEKTPLLSAPQAEEVAARWEVTSHQPDTTSGFSATLFHSLDGDGYVLAFRGTAAPKTDLAYADGGDIVLDGLALDQIVDLYNFWQQIQTGKGQAYTAVKLQALTMETGFYQAAVQMVKNGNSDMVLPGTDLTAALYIEELRSKSDVVIDEPSGTVRTIISVQSGVLYSADAGASGEG